MQDFKFSHTPVMLQESIDALNINPNGIYVDCTLGGAGHSMEIVSRLTNGKLIAFDKDEYALKYSRNKLKEHEDKIIFVNSDFKDIKHILSINKIDKVDGILADLGVSSHQIDTPERGFSYVNHGDLDMRMDTSSSFSAYDVVNHYSEFDIARIIYTYGEESFSRRIAKEIVAFREYKPIETTKELTEIISRAIPRRFHQKGNVCKKTFQAIRIEVNGELNDLDIALNDMFELLKESGRLCVITFHSLEDRIVKNVFKEIVTDCICDKSMPICVCNHKALGILHNKKPILASKEELIVNSRSKSAKLRIIEKL